MLVALSFSLVILYRVARFFVAIVRLGSIRFRGSQAVLERRFLADIVSSYAYPVYSPL